MGKDKHIPQGYKDSSLGIIPKEWEVKRLGDLCNNKGDYGLNAPATDFSIDLPTYLRITDIDNNGKFIHVDKKSVNNTLAENYYLKNGDIVFARTGATVGKTYLYDKRDGKLVYAGFLIKFSPNPSKLLSYYLKVHTETQNYWNWVSITSQRSGQPGINAAEFCSYRIAIPSLEEQKQICSILQLWDTAIEKQSELIEELTLRKRALMQKLLTGKKRLPGFSARWTKMKLGDIAEIVGGGTPNTNEPQYWDGDILWFTPSEIGKTKYVSQSERTISKKGLVNSSAKKLPIGTILFTSRATIGAKAILEKEATTNQGFQSIVVSNGNNNEFVYYYLDIIQNKIKQKASGSTFQEISAGSIRKIDIVIPSLEEQNSIASILNNADKEIDLAKEKLTSLQSQKQGLMQQLLTGKKRVV